MKSKIPFHIFIQHHTPAVGQPVSVSGALGRIKVGKTHRQRQGRGDGRREAAGRGLVGPMRRRLVRMTRGGGAGGSWRRDRSWLLAGWGHVMLGGQLGLGVGLVVMVVLLLLMLLLLVVLLHLLKLLQVLELGAE